MSFPLFCNFAGPKIAQNKGRSQNKGVQNKGRWTVVAVIKKRSEKSTEKGSEVSGALCMRELIKEFITCSLTSGEL